MKLPMNYIWSIKLIKMIVHLTKKERKLLRKVFNTQLESLGEMVIGDFDGEIDFQMYCIEHELPLNKVLDNIEQKIDIFNYYFHHPKEFLDMEYEELSMVKHILMTFFSAKKYTRERASLWRKMELNENFLFNEN